VFNLKTFFLSPISLMKQIKEARTFVSTIDVVATGTDLVAKQSGFTFSKTLRDGDGNAIKAEEAIQVTALANQVVIARSKPQQERRGPGQQQEPPTNTVIPMVGAYAALASLPPAEAVEKVLNDFVLPLFE
jgi:poly-beta-hydroxyalkanoate depolymerase